MGFPGGAVVKYPLANAGDTGDAGSTPGSGRSPGIGNGNTLQYSCLGNPLDREAWRAAVHRVTDGAHKHSNCLICFCPFSWEIIKCVKV